jgi:putative nucleotidyltransferase with HDIG domain
MTRHPAREIQSFEVFLPREPGLAAHVRRVAALAAFVASRSGFSAPEVQAVGNSGLLHHLQAEVTGVPMAARLLADLGFPPQSFESSKVVPPDAAEIVAVWRGKRKPSSPHAAEFAAILDSANLFDEQMENLPYEDESTAESVNQLLDSGMLMPSFVRTIRSSWVVARRNVDTAANALPVFPKAAMEALRLARDPDAGHRELERALGKDPVLAGEIVMLANSGALGGSAAVNSLSGALMRVGTIAAANHIAAAAVRTCFASVKLHDLWEHSLQAAENAGALAGDSNSDAGEAYLAGLVHDIGRLAFELSDAALGVRQWEESGFPTTYAEMLSTGADHTELGADVLERWSFPESIVEAVRFHHRPELVTSKLAAVLYAVEDINESLPSLARDHAAASRLEVEELPRARAAV